MDTFKLPELPTILEGRVVVVSDTVLKDIITYLQELANVVSKNAEDVAALTESRDTIVKDVSKIAGILEAIYEKN